MKELTAEPSETIWDTGPKSRGGPLMWLLALAASFFCLPLFIAWAGEHHAVTLGFACFFALLAAWAWWCIITSRASKEAIPLLAPSLLHEHLKFIIPRTYDHVAVTAFFRPDKPPGGGATCLLIFVENYASRRRLVKVKLGKCAALVPPTDAALELLLAPGQAAVYRCPLQLYPNARSGEYELRLRLSVKAPRGTGRVLKSQSGKKVPANNQIALTNTAYQLHPGFAVAAGDPVPALPLAAPGFLALSSPLTAPRFDFLRQISENGPHQSILITPPPVI